MIPISVIGGNNDGLSPTGNYAINLSYQTIATQSNSGYTRYSDQYWVYRGTSYTGPFSQLAQSTSTNTLALRVGTGSTYTVRENLWGSRWGVTGGSGTYSVEINSTDSINTYLIDSGSNKYDINGKLTHYFAWDITSATQTYIAVSCYGNGVASSNTYSVSFYVNGSQIQTLNITAVDRDVKVVWNKSTGSASVYTSILNANNFNTHIGSYTISNGNTPFYVCGIQTPATQSLFFAQQSAPGIVIANYQPNGIAGSADAINNHPPSAQMFGVNEKY